MKLDLEAGLEPQYPSQLWPCSPTLLMNEAHTSPSVPFAFRKLCVQRHFKSVKEATPTTCQPLLVISPQGSELEHPRRVA